MNIGENILGLKRENGRVDVPGLGQVRIKTFSAIEKSRQGSLFRSNKLPEEKVFAYLVLHGIVDDDGNRVFRDDQMEEVCQADGALIQFLALEISYHNDLEKEVKDAKKN